MNQHLEFAKKLALQAGKIMVEHFHPGIEQKVKEDKTLVTIADEKINQLVIDEVQKSYPSHSVFGEEGSSDKQSKLAWICDPIDGTVQYAKGVPVATFSLALTEDGAPILGVIFNPFTNHLYSASKGGGTYLDNKPIRVSQRGLEKRSTINVDWWPEAGYDIAAQCQQLSIDTTCYALSIGSVVHAASLVASGQYEAAVYAGTKGKNVDIAAAKIIVEEAGGKVTDLFGNEQRYDKDIKGAIMSNGKTHQQFVDRFASLAK